MVGATRDEVTGISRGEIDEDRLRRRLSRLGLPDDRIDAWRAARPGEPARFLGQATTDTMFRVPAVRVCEMRADARGKTYSYEFAWPSPAVREQSFHCLDIPFAFDLLDAPELERSTGPAPPQELAGEIHGAWVRFITAGDAGWPAYDLTRRATTVWQVPLRVDDDLLHLRAHAPGGRAMAQHVVREVPCRPPRGRFP